MIRSAAAICVSVKSLAARPIPGVSTLRNRTLMWANSGGRHGTLTATVSPSITRVTGQR